MKAVNQANVMNLYLLKLVEEKFDDKISFITNNVKVSIEIIVCIGCKLTYTSVCHVDVLGSIAAGSRFISGYIRCNYFLNILL